MTEAQMQDPYDVPSNFQKRERKERDYAMVPKGTRLMGCVIIKAIERKKDYNGKFEIKPGYRIVLRDKEVTNAFLNIEFNSSCKNNSDQYKIVEEMSGRPFQPNELEGKEKEYAKESAMLSRMKDIAGNWFDVVVKHKAWKTDATKFKAIGVSYEPQGRGMTDAIEFFKDIEIPLKDESSRVAEDDDSQSADDLNSQLDNEPNI
jgi:hypothetical protein